MTQPSHADLDGLLHRVLDRLEDHGAELASVKATVRANGESAKEGIEEVKARLKTIEAKVLAYDLLKSRIIGMGVVAAGAAAGLWYWFHDTFERVFGK